MSNGNVPVPRNTSGYNLGKRQHLPKPEKFRLYLYNDCNSPIDRMADILSHTFGWAVKDAKDLLNTRPTDSFWLLVKETTFEICDHKEWLLVQKIKEEVESYPELARVELHIIPMSYFPSP